MSQIWNDENITLAQLNAFGKNTLGEMVGIQFVEIGNDYLKASMPVDYRTHQPMGLLHGGASAALAETVGSVAGWMVVNRLQYACVGLEINCNHVRGKKEGIVIATAKPLHLGKTTQVWDIKINDENDHLICISRLTLAVVKI